MAATLCTYCNHLYLYPCNGGDRTCPNFVYLNRHNPGAPAVVQPKPVPAPAPAPVARKRLTEAPEPPPVVRRRIT